VHDCRTEWAQFLIGMAVAVVIWTGPQAAAMGAEARASSTAEGTYASGAIDHDRFSVSPRSIWRGHADATTWWWECRWSEPRSIGAILQVIGDDSTTLHNAPRTYVWQISLDGEFWEDLPETVCTNEQRMFRVLRLQKLRRAKFLRMQVEATRDDAPVLRHIEIFDQIHAQIEFPEWIVAVATIDRTEWDNRKGEGKQFISLARNCPEFAHLQAQYVWLDSFDEAFINVEPRPLCAFLSGNFSDFCQKDREAWRGTAAILKSGHLPIWAACGGAQGLAILADTGVDKPWDCPHCRDPAHPKSPIYGHIGHTGTKLRKCGDYSECVFEKGKTWVLAIVDDPVLEGLPREFEIIESHCGQIEYAPAGWVKLVTKGTGAKTDFQCLRMKDRPIYAAQFHIELEGTPDNSQLIMNNFLNLARREKSKPVE
jgi:Glutamine amidotransferase class-I